MITAQHVRTRPRSPTASTWQSADGYVELRRGRWQTALADVAGATLAILDPPYGQTDCHWDERPDLAELKEGIGQWTEPAATIAFFAIQPFATEVITALRPWFRYDLIWQKTMPVGFLNANRAPLRAHELVLIFSRQKGQAKYRPQMTPCKPYTSRTPGTSSVYCAHRATTRRRDSHYPRSIITAQESRCSGIHPTQKPLALIEWLVRTYTDADDLVVDPFAGSGVTAVACRASGRRCVASERDAQYFRRAVRRLEHSQS